MSNTRLATIKPTSKNAVRHMLTSGIGALIITLLVGYFVPQLGAVQLNMYTAIAIIIGAGLAGLVIAHLRGGLFFIGIISGSIAVGMTSVLYLLMSQQPGSLIGVLFVGSFVASIVSHKIHGVGEHM